MYVLHAGINHKSASITSNTDMSGDTLFVFILAMLALMLVNSQKRKK